MELTDWAILAAAAAIAVLVVKWRLRAKTDRASEAESPGQHAFGSPPVAPTKPWNHSAFAKDGSARTERVDAPPAPAPAQITASVRYHFDEDEDEDDDDEPQWVATYYDIDLNNRPHGMVPLRGFSKLKVVGTQYRLADALWFVRAAHAQPNDVRLTMTVEYNQETKRDALKIYGVVANQGHRHIGFVASEVAEKYLTQYRPNMPVALELRSVGNLLNNEAAFIEFRLLTPPANERKAYQRT